MLPDNNEKTVENRCSSTAELGSDDPAPAALLELLRMPACLVDGGGRVSRLNVAWREYAGIEDSNDEHRALAQLIHLDDRYEVLSRFRAAVADGECAAFECRLADAHGRARWFLLGLQPAGAGDSGWLCVGTDIHRFKRRELDLERRASMQTDMLNVSVDCIKLIDLDGKLIHMNKAGCRALGVAEDSAFGMPWLSLLPADVHDVGAQAIASARGGVFSRFGGRSVVPGQSMQHWDNMLTPVMGGAGQATAILCVSREVTAERAALESLRESQERLAIAVRVGGLGIWDYDSVGDRLQCDDSWYRIMGCDPGRPVRSLAGFRAFVHPEDAERATAFVQETASADGGDHVAVFRIVRPGGEVRWVRSAACLQEASAQRLRAVGFLVDITDAWRAERALRDANRALEEERSSLARQSLEDPLTGISNRRHLDRELARLCAQAEGRNWPLCIGMIDVDHFKAFNDRYGHLEGDSALRKVAQALRDVFRSADIVARYGGEEFAFVLPTLGDPLPLLERLLAAVAELGIPHLDSATGYLTLSCGCIVFGAGEQVSPTQLLKAGDEALYEAKLAGRNRYVIRRR